jgi:signal transduction histidine kinase
MNQPLRLLHIEDSEDDSLLLCRHLMRAGYRLEWERVETRQGLEAALDRQAWDVIVSDYVMPHFGALTALQVLKSRDLDLPFIIVSGAIGEETAVAAMRGGAHDYLMKGQLTRLVPAIEREMQECRIRRERRRAEEVLRTSERLASFGRLAASIAHEVNNPLEAVTNVFYLLDRCELDEQARGYLKLAEEELQRVTHIVRQSLAFTRISGDSSPALLSQLVEEVLRLYAPRIRSGQVRVEKRFECDAQVPGEVRQVVSNLLVNAVDAVRLGGAVKLRLHRGRDPRDPQRTGIRLVVADEGMGIAPEHRRDIFQPFFTTKRDKGTGLGLWISNEIVHKHGGVIRLRSSVKPGRSFSVFSVFLPVESGAAAAQHA